MLLNKRYCLKNIENIRKAFKSDIAAVYKALKDSNHPDVCKMNGFINLQILGNNAKLYCTNPDDVFNYSNQFSLHCSNFNVYWRFGIYPDIQNTNWDKIDERTRQFEQWFTTTFIKALQHKLTYVF